MVIVLFLFFFFKQKTAYEMRISDWSSDVCSSDLFNRLLVAIVDRGHGQPTAEQRRRRHDRGGGEKRGMDVVGLGDIAPYPASDRDAAGDRRLERRQCSPRQIGRTNV